VARKKVIKRKTHVTLRKVRPDGSIDHVRVPIERRAPIRPSSYSPAEKLMIIELAVMYYIDKDKHLRSNSLGNPFADQLALTRCKDLLKLGKNMRAYASEVVEELKERKLVEEIQTRRRGIYKKSPLKITEKGWRHVKRQSKRLREAAQKLIYTDVLDKLARAAR
jgi:hypothetical protein